MHTHHLHYGFLLSPRSPTLEATVTSYSYLLNLPVDVREKVALYCHCRTECMCKESLGPPRLTHTRACCHAIERIMSQ